MALLLEQSLVRSPPLVVGLRSNSEPCIELLLVVICVVWGDMAGDGCCELDATEEALIAEAGIEVELMLGRLVWTRESFARRNCAG